MKVSVVIPTLNGGDRFKEALPRIMSQKLEHEFEVVCIDSGSVDGTAEFARSLGARVVLIDKRSFNHGLTRNQGIQASEGEIIALTVQDALPMDEHWLSPLVSCLMEEEDGAGAYSRQLPRPDCNPIIKDRLLNWSAGGMEKNIQALNPETPFETLTPFEKLALISFDNVSSCIRRSVWENHPFQKRNFGEDVVWGHEIIQAGYKIIFQPASMVEHSHNNSLWYEFKRIYADHQNLNRLIGLQTVPRFKNIFKNGKGAFCHYQNLINKEDKKGMELWLITLRAFFYAYLENLAQYLGAGFQKEAAKPHGIAPWLDSLLKKGV